MLSGMVDNLIDSAKVEAGKYQLQIEPVDVFDVVDVVASTIEPLVKSKQISLHVSYNDEIPLIASDWEALRTIITNLVGNATKFTGEGGQISIDGSYNIEEKAVVIRVADNGCGISPEALESIFDRFEQDKNSEKNIDLHSTHGSGLGLSLSKELSNMMGGDISVESELGVGSIFTLVLPANTEMGIESFETVFSCSETRASSTTSQNSAAAKRKYMRSCQKSTGATPYRMRYRLRMLKRGWLRREKAMVSLLAFLPCPCGSIS